ncbi:ParB N-terminal domain-containing protein [Vibrio maritimus]|uniref:ParB N-terminal domain-containing protein n=1 Tax=Vibrio maritimus TaxID=990268 RepID=UPI001F3D6502|nr:ParB N-terminal domain-containing protein [Vibrio maritimus]
MIDQNITELVDSLVRLSKQKTNFDFEERVAIFNKLSKVKRNIIDVYDHPILNVTLKKPQHLYVNDYNPNFIAPPEKKLLLHSIQRDGLTLPIIVCPIQKDNNVIIDGHHRFTLIKSKPNLISNLQGYIPTVSLKRDLPERMSATIRHNLAKGQHQVELTSQLLLKLKALNWTDDAISNELGMDRDEILRMLQTTGLLEAFGNRPFSKAWV